jgi:hypothetical protein
MSVKKNPSRVFEAGLAWLIKKEPEPKVLTGCSLAGGRVWKKYTENFQRLPRYLIVLIRQKSAKSLIFSRLIG